MYFIDGGDSCVLQAARVRKDHEGRGVYRFMFTTCSDIARKRGVLSLMFGTASTQPFYQKQFEKAYKVLVNLHVISNLLSTDMGARLNSLPCTDLHKLTGTDLSTYFNNKRVSSYLFPDGRVVLDWIPYRIVDDNSPLLEGYHTEFYSDITTVDHKINGLLSAWTQYKCNRPGRFYFIEIFGRDINSVSKHISFFLRKCSMSMIQKKCPCSLHVSSEDVNMAVESLRVLKALDIPKYHWCHGLTEDGMYNMTFFMVSLSKTQCITTDQSKL